MSNLSEKKLFVIFFKLWIILSNVYLIFFCCLTIICKMISCMELLIIYQSLFSCRNSHLFVHYNGWTCHFTPAVFNFICLLKVLEICTQIVHTYAYLYFSMKKKWKQGSVKIIFLGNNPSTHLAVSYRISKAFWTIQLRSIQLVNQKYLNLVKIISKKKNHTTH